VRALGLAVVLAGCGAEPEASWFVDGVGKIELSIDADNLSQLKLAPREWAEATMLVHGVAYEHVAVRIKGHRSKKKIGDKPALKLHFSRFVPGRLIFGLEGLTLNNMVEDPSMEREAIAYRVHRSLGVRAPRTAYATLSINGEHRGLYLLLEPIDRRFVAGGDSVYEGEYGCDLYPDDVDGFDRDAGEGPRDDLMALARAAEGTDLFAGGSPIDRERVVSYLAVSAVIGDFDGYRQSHNYYLHREAARNKWSLVPWGLDRAFQTHVGIYDSGGLLAKKCFADGACREQYHEKLRAAVEAIEAIDREGAVDRIRSTIDRALKTDPKKPYKMTEVQRSALDLSRFLRERPTRVRKQLGAPAPREKVACQPLQTAGAEFLLCTAPMTWEDANDHCASRGMTLAKVESAEQSKALFRGTQSLRKTRWWIGFNDRKVEDDFQWIDGSAVIFTDWDKGEPDNYVCNQDCGAIVDGKDGRWHDNHCAQRYPFICR
jgi:hypothetical protein